MLQIHRTMKKNKEQQLVNSTINSKLSKQIYFDRVDKEINYFYLRKKVTFSCRRGDGQVL